MPLLEVMINNQPTNQAITMEEAVTVSNFHSNSCFKIHILNISTNLGQPKPYQHQAPAYGGDKPQYNNGGGYQQQNQYKPPSNNYEEKPQYGGSKFFT